MKLTSIGTVGLQDMAAAHSNNANGKIANWLIATQIRPLRNSAADESARRGGS